MMSLRLIVIVSTYVMVLAAAADVAAMDFRRALLNNFGDGKAQTCNDVDWQMIDNILITSAKIVELPTPISNGYNRRYLRSGEERLLQTASQCRSACEGYATGRCFARGCGWWNKANSAVAPPLDALDSVTKTEPAPDGTRTRTLKKDNAMITTPCSEQQIKYINHELNNLIRTKAVTASCQSLLKDSRHITCYRRTDDINELDAVM